jgi:hypothetical protein
MAETPLKTAKFLEQAAENEAGFTDQSLQGAMGEGRSAIDTWQRAATWMSLMLGAAVVVCIAGIAISSLAGLKLPKSAYLIDWWLWFGGAKTDQTFEKFVRDASTKNQDNWDELYRQSPAYQLKDLQGVQFNQSPMFNQSPAFGSGASSQRH